ncbi:MAG: HEPN domain-containing protein [Fimbriimonadaceae bacterium]|nr:HEPN domain-containing protein [Fimbriimonadaceae bacterium]
MSNSRQKLPPSRQWLEQAQADYRAAEILAGSAEPGQCCQASAKCQQAVEKALKGVATLLVESGEQTAVPQLYEHRVDRFMTTIRRFRRPLGYRQRVQQDFGDTTLSHRVAVLCALAPQRPEPGQLHARNTEYPYEVAADHWTHPAAPGQFTTLEVEQHLATAKQVVGRAACLLAGHARRAVPTAARRSP